MKLTLTRPLVIFDIESTGTNKSQDRIIDLAILKLHPDGHREERCWRVNPERKIPPEATAIHGIRDEDVAGCPPFREKAKEVSDFMAGCDFAGFNIVGFDIPMLDEELGRAGFKLHLEERYILDAQRIFHKREPRNLTAALQFYCGELHLGAHGAMADVEATLKVIEGQFERYPDLPHQIEELDLYCVAREPDWADRSGKLRWVKGEIVINFGKKAGNRLRDLVKSEKSFLEWILRGDFPKDTRDIVQKALLGIYPEPPHSIGGTTLDV